MIAYPTEGVWGLGCDPDDPVAVLKILALKQRPISKGLILVADSPSRVLRFVEDMPEIPDTETPTTWLIAHGGKTPNWISGGSDKVAVRISQHPLVAAICARAKSPIVSTSANPAGMSPARTATKVRQYFGNLIDVIVPGVLGHQTGPSIILDWETKEVIREVEK